MYWAHYYALYIVDIPEISAATIATFTYDIALLASSLVYADATSALQNSLDLLHTWTNCWKILLSSEKSINVTFSLQPHPHTPIALGREIIPYKTTTKYLGIHLDERLTYTEHIRTKRQELELCFWKLHWVFDKRSSLTLASKRLLYLAVLLPIWAYALPVWGCASNSLRLII